jgi:hypothetical protein
MKVDIRDLEAVEKILVRGEKVEGSATQRRLGPGGSLTSPTSVIVTDKRIIVIKRAVFGLRHDYEVFSLSTITSIKLKHGFVSSSIFVRTQGSEADSGKHGSTEGEIFGLTKNDAEDLANLINGNLARMEAHNLPSHKHDTAHKTDLAHKNDATRKHEISHRHEGPSAEDYEFCSKCGAKILKTAKFCKSCGAKV